MLAELRPGPAPLLAAVVLAVAFIGCVVAHQRSRRQERWWVVLRDLNARGLMRLERDWTSLPRREAPWPTTDHSYAEDLDLFGAPALAQLFGPVATPAGRRILASWLLAPADQATVRSRQEAVRELAPLIDFRDELAGRALPSAEVEPADIDRFLAWAESGRDLPLRALRVAAVLLPLATFALVVADLAGSIGPPLWILPILGAAAITFGPGRAVDAEFRRAFGREGLLRAYPAMLEAVSRLEPSATVLVELRNRLAADSASARRELRRLERLMHLADVRYSGSLYIMVQLLTLWDVHVMVAVDRWRRRSGGRVREWLDALGELEALAALAAMAHDHGEWCFPEIDDAATRITARGAGHPMIPEDRRVDNDFEVGPPGTFLLITGSNMSGKSTLLRAIGANVVLALAGAPVCAREMRLPTVRIGTSIRVADSVVQGVSYFMAQLVRMREIVNAAERARTQGPRLLYLLDEILQGTNTAERRIAATHVIRHLVDAGAIGAVTTHDLELADEPALRDAVVAVHFTETIIGVGPEATMTFDYRLRPGVATSTNALRLMEMVGLSPGGTATS